MYFVAALLIALFGFVGSAALAKFLLRGELIEEHSGRGEAEPRPAGPGAARSE